MKKRAFIKYTKKGNIIPGSLIITTNGGYPVDGLYYETPIDLCCTPETSRIFISFTTTYNGIGGQCVSLGFLVNLYINQQTATDPQVGDEVWSDQLGTIPANDGDYSVVLPGSISGYITVVDGVITDVNAC